MAADAETASRCFLVAFGPARLHFALAVNNFEPPLLLVERRDGESAEELLEFLQARFRERPDKQPGPVYTIGATYVCRSRRFCRVHTCAGELVLRMIFEKSDRSLIARFDSNLPLRLLSRDREAIDLDPNEIVEEAE